MKCQSQFPGKNKKNISKCCILKFLPRVLSVKICLEINFIQLQECFGVYSSLKSHKIVNLELALQVRMQLLFISNNTH